MLEAQILDSKSNIHTKPPEKIEEKPSEVKFPVLPINRLKPEDEILMDIDKTRRLPSYAYKVIADNAEDKEQNNPLKNVIKNNSELGKKKKRINPVQTKINSIINNNLLVQFDNIGNSKPSTNNTLPLFKLAE